VWPVAEEANSLKTAIQGANLSSKKDRDGYLFLDHILFETERMLSVLFSAMHSLLIFTETMNEILHFDKQSAG
jgi:hypothetical protein